MAASASGSSSKRAASAPPAGPENMHQRLTEALENALRKEILAPTINTAPLHAEARSRAEEAAAALAEFRAAGVQQHAAPTRGRSPVRRADGVVPGDPKTGWRPSWLSDEGSCHQATPADTPRWSSGWRAVGGRGVAGPPSSRDSFDSDPYDENWPIRTWPDAETSYASCMRELLLRNRRYDRELQAAFVAWLWGCRAICQRRRAWGFFVRRCKNELAKVFGGWLDATLGDARKVLPKCLADGLKHIWLQEVFGEWRGATLPYIRRLANRQLGCIVWPAARSPRGTSPAKDQAAVCMFGTTAF